MCKNIILSQKEDITVAQCGNCRVLNIWRSGMLMTFSFSQFDAFYEVTKHFKFDEFVEIRPDGKEVVVLSTPYPDINLVFTRKEWRNFFEAMEEANFMKKVYGIVHE